MGSRRDAARLTPRVREGDGAAIVVSTRTTPPNAPDTPTAGPPTAPSSAKNGQQSVAMPAGHRTRLVAYLDAGHATTEIVAATGHAVSEASVRRARDGKQLLRSSIAVICAAVDKLAPAAPL